MRKPELLIPAGDLETLKIAVAYGADAVYLGGEAFSLRAKAKNFSMEELREGIAFAHERKVRVYVAANVFAHGQELHGVESYFEKLRELKPDALILSDPGVIMLAKKLLPEAEIHISTQWSNTNYETFLFWYRQGASKVVAARELSLSEIREIREHIPADLQIECFVHGAMCISYSGKCLLSNYFTGRDSNHGECTHPCRWKYGVCDQKEPMEEPKEYVHLLNSCDLCMVDHIPDLIKAGIDSFKVEGRMKTALYVATVARTYRKAIDDYLESPEKYQENMPWYLEQIKSCTYRQFTTGFFYGKPSEETQIYDNNTYEKGYTYLGIVGPKNEKGMYRMEQKNKFSVGEQIEVMKPDGRNVTVTVRGLMDEKGEPMESCPHPQQIFYVDLGMEPDEYDILRRREEEAIALD